MNGEANDTNVRDLNLLDTASSQEKTEIQELATEYLQFLRQNMTDRERVQWAIALLQKEGYVEFKMGQDAEVKPGTKFYYMNKSKSFLCGIVGKTQESLTVVGTHVDVPHVDLKPNFVNEQADQGCVTLKTHYYGGIKKYLFATTPLLMKINSMKDGKVLVQTIGDQPEDPVFTIPDLLVHLSQNQSERKMREVIKAEEMKVLAGSTKGEFTKFSDNFLKLLEERTGITKKDLPYCEFQLFPAYPPKYVGLDKSMIGASGQDDGICSFAAIKALQQLQAPEHTSAVVFHSYEETGSNGTAGAQSNFMSFALSDLMDKQKISPSKQRYIQSNAVAIAADVTALFDVNFPSQHDRLTAAVLNKGVAIARYTGSAGKSGSSEAPVELIQIITQKLKRKWFQMESMGISGGGGTTAKFLSQQLNCEVIDVGPGVMNMHSPFEVSSVYDLFATVCVYAQILGRE
ncbi:Aminopeptidase_I [Hexamita inflata]|uniref:Aminopeptidase I n=1 Tax=Hexamita inflata TaxID=28002 RepID=A0AA86P0S4_9EUKA|nr:Aminopeptidase I [Hexamita inflata]